MSGRVAVVDVGTNSTRLLIADVRDGAVVEEVERRSVVTRLGAGVDASGCLAADAMDRVHAVLADYRAVANAAGAARPIAVMTSAVRDAANGAAFRQAIGDRYGFDARVLSGDEEARLTFLGANTGTEPTLVIDVGGGSTELVVGSDGRVDFHVSTQLGVVRHSERHLHDDPPEPEQLRALAGDARELLAHAVPDDVRTIPRRAVAVAGTATSLAAIDLGLDPYDPARVEGRELTVARCRELLRRLSAVPLAERRTVPGLHPDRAPTIVAGVVLLLEALGRFGLDAFTASEHDLLYGAALDASPHA